MKKIQHLKFGSIRKKYGILTLVPTIKCLVVRAIHGKIFLQFFRNLLPGIRIPLEDCIEACLTLFWMILIALSKQEIPYTIIVLSLTMKMGDNIIMIATFFKQDNFCIKIYQKPQPK